MSSIENLKSIISQKEGIAQPTLFRVTMPSIAGVSSREMDALCSDVTFPGRRIVTQERRIGLINQKIAYDQLYDDVTMTFLLLNDYGARKYFETWQNLIIDQETLEVGYHLEYAKTIKIAQLKKGFGFPGFKMNLGIPQLPAEIQNRLPSIGPFDFAQGQLDLNLATGANVVYECELLEAYPTDMNPIQMSNAANDTILSMTVSFAYKNWRSDFKGDPGGIGSFIKRTGAGFLSRVIN